MNATALEPSATWHLTGRESRIVELVALGKSSKEVAKTLTISPSTVDTHLENAKLKLGAHNRASLIARAVAAGLIRFEEDGSIIEHPAPDEAADSGQGNAR
ncbi:response regulator transcription factor [Sphingomicrobium aestuariivivum]|uniref:response regulator transcription factor n=1 Tax=Sphingomicrobium aestuariivivum TaxID=1582356 RepID=UPI001FD69E4A|nr:helix-turn-helix transcriptional regulator [Sphingomicrobium aestuariivivum]MCJ8189826.1 helix-turn-helix transcriptional regulator [Sphingomicrobium aestuariivivum]